MPKLLDKLEALIAADEESTSGVYCILNTVNQKRYIGSSARKISNRIRDHIKALNAGRHCNKHLQSAWDKYGPKAFRFYVLKRCTPDRVTELEQEFIDTYHTWNPKYGYNISPSASNTLGMPCSEETKAKISAAKRGKKLSAGTRAKMSATRKGIDPRRYWRG